MNLSRREFLAKAAATALAAGCFSSRAAPNPSPRLDMGIVTYSLGIHQRATKGASAGLDYNDPLGFLEACHRLGAGGVQLAFGERPADYAGKFCRQAERWEMRVEAILDLPKGEADLARFEKQVLSATQCGATVARTTMLPGRRYAEFKTREAFEQASAQGLKSLQLAVPVAARNRLRIAVENHKDHLIAEKLEVLKQISSEYVGMCVDVSNNFALCEDLVEVVRAFAPWAFTVHIKDQAIQECDEGFWLTDVALGRGFLPLGTMVQALRQARPNIHFNLEVITRDPIKVPVRADSYWATFPGRSRSVADPMLRTARQYGVAKPLPLVSTLTPAEQMNVEQHHVEQSLQYARETLRL